MADAADSKSADRKVMGVRLPPPAPPPAHPPCSDFPVPAARAAGTGKSEIHFFKVEVFRYPGARHLYPVAYPDILFGTDYPTSIELPIPFVLPFFDGFESGDALAWSAALP